MKRILLSLFAVMVSLSLVATAEAAKPEKKKKKSTETGPDLSKIFNGLDKNGDGKLSKSEFNAFNGLDSADAPAKTKKKKKEQVSLVEDAKKKKKKAKTAAGGLTQAQKDEYFTKLDVNKDGFLILDEFSKVKEVTGGTEKKEAKKKKKKAK